MVIVFLRSCCIKTSSVRIGCKLFLGTTTIVEKLLNICSLELCVRGFKRIVNTPIIEYSIRIGSHFAFLFTVEGVRFWHTRYTQITSDTRFSAYGWLGRLGPIYGLPDGQENFFSSFYSNFPRSCYFLNQLTS
jgi:hypothetical protein